jgi:hypothetical protein
MHSIGFFALVAVGITLFAAVTVSLLALLPESVFERARRHGRYSGLASG